MSQDRIGRRVVVHGRVQGVFYRASTRREAQDAGVAGWVRNAEDGTVHAHVEGAPEAVERMLAWMRRGPRHAQVDRVEVQVADPEGHAGFAVR